MKTPVDKVKRMFVAELNFCDGQHCYETGQTLGLLPLPRNVWEVNVHLEIDVFELNGNDRELEWNVVGVEYIVCNYKPDHDYCMAPTDDWDEITKAMQAEIDLFCAEVI